MVKLKQLGDYRIDAYLQQLEVTNGCTARLDARIWDMVMKNHNAQLLMSMNGIGQYTTLAMSAEIEDIFRFPDSKKLCSYVDVAPPARNFADVPHPGHITKRGNHVMRGLLSEAVKAHHGHEPDSSITKHYLRIKEKGEDANAVIAASAKMLHAMY